MLNEQDGKFTRQFLSAIESYLFLNDIKDDHAREFITAMFHEIKHQADIIEHLHEKIKTIERKI